ncbi:MAG: hypothetical protein LBS94_04500, partial [Prevotellaceae bacterium]|nr:hypothetical protein [Prevotellaceae bacterium]
MVGMYEGEHVTILEKGLTTYTILKDGEAEPEVVPIAHVEGIEETPVEALIDKTIEAEDAAANLQKQQEEQLLQQAEQQKLLQQQEKEKAAASGNETDFVTTPEAQAGSGTAIAEKPATGGTDVPPPPPPPTEHVVDKNTTIIALPTGEYQLKRTYTNDKAKAAEKEAKRLSEIYVANGLAFEVRHLPKQDPNNRLEVPLLGVFGYDVQKRSQAQIEEMERQRQAREEAKAAADKEKMERDRTGASTITQRWSAAKKYEGAADEFVLTDGSVVEGTYALVEADAPTPSHDPERGYAPSEGFPTTDAGTTVNDRDY